MNRNQFHSLMQVALDDLKRALVEAERQEAEGVILRALTGMGQLCDLLTGTEGAMTDLDPEEYCCAI